MKAYVTKSGSRYPVERVTEQDVEVITCQKRGPTHGMKYGIIGFADLDRLEFLGWGNELILRDKRTGEGIPVKDIGDHLESEPSEGLAIVAYLLDVMEGKPISLETRGLDVMRTSKIERIEKC